MSESDTTRTVDDLEEAAQELERASNRLYHATREFEGGPDGDGVWQPGPNLRWRVAVSEAIEAIVDEKFADTRTPAVERLERMAELRVCKTDPDLYADYHRLSAEIIALQKWCSAKKEAISARQSVLRAEGLLVGGPTR